ncbi:MAG: DNA-binding protein [Thermoprotei archaeon]|nr:MAG: DNA-binding protein [Thermoprotei archaeon]
MPRREPLSSFLACRRCKALFSVPQKSEEPIRCPYCGSTDVSDDWEGLVIIADVNSLIAQRLNIKRPGYYAIKVR